MKRSLLAITILLITISAHAQISIPFAFTSEEDNRLVKENDSVKIYVASGDSTRRVSINEDASYYKLFTHDHKIIAEGSFIVEGEKYLKSGKWTTHYDNGRTKLTGSFDRNKPAGTWLEYYNTGELKTVSNYGIIISSVGEKYSCLSGTYEEYFPSGKLKISGVYAAGRSRITDTIGIEDPVTGKNVVKEISKDNYTPVKTGHWEYYTEEGELEKKEEL